MRLWFSMVLLALIAAAPAPAGQTTGAGKPNIVLIFPDNLGIGELAIYGGNRGVATPRLDALAVEGLRLTNFNAEYFCIASRAAILTGRHSIRSGTHGYRPQKPGSPYSWHGLTQWEVTIAEMLAPLGYTSGVFGKWHLGDNEERLPTKQGFDEWYAIPLSSNEAERSTTGEAAYIWEGTTAAPSRKVKIFDLATRRTVDREATDRARGFMERSTKARKPFFLFLALTQIHYPTLPHPEFAGKTGAGDIGDAMAEMDRNVGVVLDAVKRLGIEKNTIFIFAGDGGTEWRRPYRGTAGPWRGFYATALEGGLRTPFMIRWPGRIPGARVSNEIVHQVDLFATLAHAVGAAVPKDRAIDSVDLLPFFEGRQAKSGREGFPIYIGAEIRAVMWRDWKLHYAWQEESGQPLEKVTKLFNLRADPKEETDVLEANPWAEAEIGKIANEFKATLENYPLIPVGTPEPYLPPGSPKVGSDR
jgi:arylsulfatase A-like enzyme